MGDLPASRRWPIVAAALALYITCLLIAAPAWLLAWWVAHATDNVASLERPEGVVWRGRASTLVIAVPGSDRQRFSNVTWRVSGARLLKGQLVVEVNVDSKDTKGSGTLAVEPRAIQLLQSNLTLPASATAAFFPALQLVRARGEITVRIKDLLIRRDSALGDAEMEWINASTGLSAVNPLGTYRVLAKAKDGPVQFEIITLNGALQLAGGGAWSATQGLSFSGTAQANPSQAANLRNLLLLLGRDDGNGNFQLKYAARSKQPITSP